MSASSSQVRKGTLLNPLIYWTLCLLGFDPAFYARQYPDLGGRNPLLLFRHYLRFGKSERRIPHPIVLQKRLSATLGLRRSAFDISGYAQSGFEINDDIPNENVSAVSVLDHHKKQFKCQSSFDATFYNDLYHPNKPLDTHLLQLDWKRHRREGRFANWSEMLEHYDFNYGCWITLIQPAVFSALNESWTTAVPNHPQAVLAFLKHGVDRLAPLAIGYEFEPSFYREFYQDLSALTDVELYKHWLSNGFPDGNFPSARAFLSHFGLDPSDYPINFDWRAYAGSQPQYKPNRWSALKHFIENGGRLEASKYINDDTNDSLCTLATAYSKLGRDTVVIETLEIASKAGTLPPQSQLELANAYFRLCLWKLALREYDQLISSGRFNLEAVHNGVNSALNLADTISASSLLTLSKSRFEGQQQWLELVNRTASVAFETAYSKSLTLFHSGHKEVADEVLSKASDFLVNLFATLWPLGSPVRPLENSEVIFISPFFTCCARSNPHLKGAWEKIAGDGRQLKVLSPSNIEGIIEALTAAKLMILDRVAATPNMIKVALVARAMGVPTYYAVTTSHFELMQDEEPPSSVAKCHDGGSEELCWGWASLTYAASALCDYGAAPNKLASDRLGMIVRRRRSFIVPDIDNVYATGEVWIDPLEEELGRFPCSRSLLTDPAILEHIGARACRGTSAWVRASGFIPRSIVDPLFAEINSYKTEIVEPCRHQCNIPSRPDNAGSLREIDAFPSASPNTEAVNEAFSTALRPVDILRYNRKGRRVRPRLLLSNTYFPPQTIGGATRVVRDNIDSWIDSGICKSLDIAVVSTDNEGKLPNGSRIDSYRGLPVLRVSPRGGPDIDWRPFDDGVGSVFKQFINSWRPSLVHFHAAQRLTASCLKACQDLDVPYIVTIHDAWWISDWMFLIDDDGQLREPLEPLRKPTRLGVTTIQSQDRIRRLTKELSRATAVLTVSETFAELYRRAGISNVLAVSNGLPHVKSLPRKPSSSGRVRLGHVGGMSAHKGFHLIYSAIYNGNYSNLEIIIVDHHHDSLGIEREVWGNTPVSIISAVPQAFIHEIYAEMDVLLAPSTWPESYGLVAREALASGLWVVAGDLGAMGGDIEAGVNGFVIDVSTTSGLSSVLAEIDGNPSRYRDSPRQKTSLRSTSQQAAELAEIYHDICRI